jgi:hypothetical protein
MTFGYPGCLFLRLPFLLGPYPFGSTAARASAGFVPGVIGMTTLATTAAVVSSDIISLIFMLVFIKSIVLVTY